MKTDTAERIIQMVAERQAVTAKEMVSYLQFSPQAVFRQLKRLVEAGKLRKFGSPPKVFYQLGS